MSNHNYDEYFIKILHLDQFYQRKAEKRSHYHGTESEASFSSFSNMRQFSPVVLMSLFYLSDFLCFESPGRNVAMPQIRWLIPARTQTTCPYIY